MASAAWEPAAELLSMMYNVNRDTAKTKPLQPIDFNPFAARPIVKPAKIDWAGLRAAFVPFPPPPCPASNPTS
jgi:hypothetical protein